MSDQQRLREAASALRGYSTDLLTEIDDLIEDFPASDDIWAGRAADDFYEARSDARRQLKALADEIDDYADALDEQADAESDDD